MPHLTLVKVPRNDADDVSAGGHGRIGHHTHQANPAAAKNERDVPPRCLLTKLLRGIQIGLVHVARRAAVDAKRFQPGHWLQNPS